MKYNTRVYLPVHPRTSRLGQLYLCKQLTYVRGTPHCVFCGMKLDNPAWGFGFFWGKAQLMPNHPNLAFLFLPGCPEHRKNLEAAMDQYLADRPNKFYRPEPFDEVDFRLILAEPFKRLGCKPEYLGQRS